jgi:hypothetical protein
MLLVNASNARDHDNPDSVQPKSLLAVAYSWFPAFLVTYAIEFLCMCAALLMVLDRMSVFAASEDTRLQKRWAAAGSIVMAVVVLGNAVGLAANAAAAVHFQKLASYHVANNNTKDGYNFTLLRKDEAQLAGSIASVQRFAEVAVLLLIVVAFAVVGVLCARILNTRLKPVGVDAGYDAFMARVSRTLRRHMLGTTAFIFVTFLLRSVLSTMYAVVFQLRNFDKKCPLGTSPCDASCYNLFTLMSRWMNNTPEFQLTVILISSPLAQLVALWGMTSKSMLRLMMSSKRYKASALTTPMQPKESYQLSIE